MNKEFRCYTFTHFMLSPIQEGIQSGHASMELVNKYMLEQGWVDGPAEQVSDWIKDHKTIICLNGGNSAGLKDLYAFLNDTQNTFPFVPFYEDEESAEGMMTSIATILPERIFETSELMRRRELPEGVHYTNDKLLQEHRFTFAEDNETRLETFSEWEYELMTRLNSCALAR